MTTLARSCTNLIAAADARVITRGLRRLSSVDPLLLAFMIAVAALAATVCLFALAAVATLFGAEAFGNFLRDAGQQVGGAGGLGAAGAGAAGAARRYEEGLEFEEDGDVTPWREVFHRDIEERDRSFWGRATKVSREIQRAAEYFVGTDIIGTVPGGSKG